MIAGALLFTALGALAGALVGYAAGRRSRAAQLLDRCLADIRRIHSNED